MSKLNTDLIRLWTEPATRGVNNKLYPLVAAGDPQAREEMIHRNMGMAIAKVDHFLIFLPRYSHLRDDLIGDALLGLTKAVNYMQREPARDEPYPTEMMSLAIQAAIGDAIETAGDIPVSRHTKKRNQRKGIEITTPEKVETIFNDGDEICDRFSYDPRKMQELRETLEACCENDTDREILRLREEGYVDREIAEILGIPQTTTYVMRRTMYARFLELTGWKGEA